jgi:hypothetical protein
MPQEMKGRRIPVVDPMADPYDLLKEPGDYYGPTMFCGYLSVWYILPNAKDDPRAIGLHHCKIDPPQFHSLIEESDGTLTLRNSIGAGPPNYYWHGFLNQGDWMLTQRDKK